MRISGSPSCTIESMQLQRPVVLKRNQPCPIQVIVSRLDDVSELSYRVRIAMRDATGWVTVAQSKVRAQVAHAGPEAVDVESLIDACDTDRIDADEHYTAMREHGLDYGPAFAGLRSRVRSQD
ncbi:unnamed protein product, partial [Hapterophycus canaliculatus]